MHVYELMSIQLVRHGSQPSSPTRSMSSQPSTLSTTTSSTTRPRSAMSSPTRNAALEDEYVRNLQQQVYLLELETRYLRGNRGGGYESMGDGAGDNTPVGGLKQKYMELQNIHKQETKVRAIKHMLVSGSGSHSMLHV